MRKFAGVLAVAVVAALVLPAAVGARPARPRVKQHVAGAIDRQGQPSAAAIGAGVDRWVVEFRWETLQPTSIHDPLQAGVPGEGGTADIDAAIAAAAGRRGVLKLRFADRASQPDWAKARGAGPLRLQHCTSTAPCVDFDGPAFWEAGYQSAYRNLQALLAARYDAVPEIGEIVNCSTAVFFCDDTKQMGDADNVAVYTAAGYTRDKDIAAQKAGIDAHAATWRRTPTAKAFFPFQHIDPATGLAKNDATISRTIMDHGKRALGRSRWIEENYSASATNLNDPLYAGLYGHLRADANAGWITHYQTATPAKVGNLCVVLDWAAHTQKATQVELPRTYDTVNAMSCELNGPADSIQFYDARLEANAAERS
jgi:hypothetical protein